jgi:hypothetical protein
MPNTENHRSHLTYLRKVLEKYALTERFEEAIKELSGFVDLNLLLCWRGLKRR